MIRFFAASPKLNIDFVSTNHTCSSTSVLTSCNYPCAVLQDDISAWCRHNTFYLSSLHSSSPQLAQKRKPKCKHLKLQTFWTPSEHVRSTRDARSKVQRAARCSALRAEEAAAGVRQCAQAADDSVLYQAYVDVLLAQMDAQDKARVCTGLCVNTTLCMLERSRGGCTHTHRV